MDRMLAVLRQLPFRKVLSDRDSQATLDSLGSSVGQASSLVGIGAQQHDQEAAARVEPTF